MDLIEQLTALSGGDGWTWGEILGAIVSVLGPVALAILFPSLASTVTPTQLPPGRFGRVTPFVNLSLRVMNWMALNVGRATNADDAEPDPPRPRRNGPPGGPSLPTVLVLLASLPVLAGCANAIERGASVADDLREAEREAMRLVDEVRAGKFEDSVDMLCDRAAIGDIRARAARDRGFAEGYPLLCGAATGDLVGSSTMFSPGM